MFMIPRGFAHGFVVLSDEATFTYKCDDVYHPNDEGGIPWNDPTIGIEWPYEGEPCFRIRTKSIHLLLKVKSHFDL